LAIFRPRLWLGEKNQQGRFNAATAGGLSQVLQRIR
jgi:hypothetical protein